MSDFDWSRYDDLSARWTTRTRDYCQGINRFVEIGTTKGWDEAGEEPQDTRDEALADEVVAVVREANAAGAWRGLRERFPTAHRPFIPWLERAAIGFGEVVWIDDDRIFARVGSPWDDAWGILFSTSGEATPIKGIEGAARSPDRRYFARAWSDRAEIVEGWDGPVVMTCKRPTGAEGLLPGWPRDAEWYLVDLRVMPEGDGVVWVTSAGVFFANDERVTRLWPQCDPEVEDDDDKHLHTDMIHAAISPRGDAIAVGAQDGGHALVTPQGEILNEDGPWGSEYPHHAFFLDGGRLVGFNSCHFYNGVTTVLPVADFLQLEDSAWEIPDAGTVVHGGARVYASVEHQGAILLGDAGGYVRAQETNGQPRWQHFVGSTVGGLDTSPDEGRLAVGTAAGFLSLISLETGEAPTTHIGTGTHREDLRFVRWAGEPLWRW